MVTSVGVRHSRAPQRVLAIADTRPRATMPPHALQRRRRPPKGISADAMKAATTAATVWNGGGAEQHRLRPTNGLGPGDASQAPPPERASPGPVAPTEMPPPKRMALAPRARKPGAGRGFAGVACLRPCMARGNRSKRPRFCRYCLVRTSYQRLCQRLVAPPSSGTILPPRGCPVKGVAEPNFTPKWTPPATSPAQTVQPHRVASGRHA